MFCCAPLSSDMKWTSPHSRPRRYVSWRPWLLRRQLRRLRAGRMPQSRLVSPFLGNALGEFLFIHCLFAFSLLDLLATQEEFSTSALGEQKIHSRPRQRCGRQGAPPCQLLPTCQYQFSLTGLWHILSSPRLCPASVSTPWNSPSWVWLAGSFRVKQKGLVWRHDPLQ